MAVPAGRLLPGARRDRLLAAPGSTGRRHQARPGDQPGRTAGALAAPVGPAGRLRPGPEPGLRLPLPDGSVLLARAPGRASRRGSSSGAGGRCCWSSRSSGWSSCARSSASARRPAGSSPASRSPSRRGSSPSSGPISIEAWPSALAPWVLVPLVIGARRGSPRRAALLSALAVAAVGGVNAAATFAVIPLGVVWLLTREPGPRRRSMMMWWPTFVVAGTFWWLVPLFLLGRYSPPFLDYIETARVTTFPTTVFDALRGTSHWVPYVDFTWQAGNDLITTSYVALNTGVLLLFGVAGPDDAAQPAPPVPRAVAARRPPDGHRRARGCHRGLVRRHRAQRPRRRARAAAQRAQVRPDHPRAPGARAGAPARGPGRPEPARLPRGAGRARPTRSATVWRTPACCWSRSPRSPGIAGPGVRGPARPGQRLRGGAGLLVRRRDWLDEQRRRRHDRPAACRGRASATTCGATPTTSRCNHSRRLRGRCATPYRSLRPATSGCSTRSRSSWRPDVRRTALARLPEPGRNRLTSWSATTCAGPTRPPPVRDPPGARRLAGDPAGRRLRPRRGQSGPGRAAARIPRSSTTAGPTTTRRSRSTPSTARTGPCRRPGARWSSAVPRTCSSLLDTGLIGDAPTVLAVDAAEDVDSSHLVLTDGLRRQERNFARIRDATSATLAADDDGRRGAPARDYTIGDSRWETHAKILGAKALTASSSQADADSPGAGRSPSTCRSPPSTVWPAPSGSPTSRRPASRGWRSSSTSRWTSRTSSSPSATPDASGRSGSGSSPRSAAVSRGRRRPGEPVNVPVPAGRTSCGQGRCATGRPTAPMAHRRGPGRRRRRRPHAGAPAASRRAGARPARSCCPRAPAGARDACVDGRRRRALLAGPGAQRRGARCDRPHAPARRRRGLPRRTPRSPRPTASRSRA